MTVTLLTDPQISHHFKQEANKLFRLPSVLGGESRRRDVEKCGSAFSSDGFGQKSLPRARRSHHQDPLKKETIVWNTRSGSKVRTGHSLWISTFHGLRMPLKKSGIHIGKTTASLRSFLGSSKSAMSSLKKFKNNGKNKEKQQIVVTFGYCQEGDQTDKSHVE